MVLSKKLHHDEKLQLELMDKISYEFKDSLNSILGFSQILQKDCRDESQIKLIKNVIISSEKLMTFVENFSNFSTFVSEDYQRTSNLFSIRTLSCEVLSSFDPIIKKKELELDCSLPNIKITNDHKVVSQVLFSLFDHIIKVAPQNGAIFINIQQIENEVIYEIKTNTSVPSSKNKNNLCENMGLFFVKNLLNIINAKISIGKDQDGFAQIKLSISNYK